MTTTPEVRAKKISDAIFAEWQGSCDPEGYQPPLEDIVTQHIIATILADSERAGELERELGERNLEQSLDFKDAQRRAVEAEAKLTKAVKGLEKIIRTFNESRSPIGQHNHCIDIAREALAEIGETHDA